jgi:hypothetical protein
MGVESGHDARTGGRADRLGDIRILEYRAFACERIEVRRLNPVVSVATHRVAPLLVREDKEEIRFRLHANAPLWRKRKFVFDSKDSMARFPLCQAIGENFVANSHIVGDCPVFSLMAGSRRMNTYVAQQRGGLRNARPENFYGIFRRRRT